MTRAVLDAEKIHPQIRDQVASFHADVVGEVQAAVAEHDVVVVGMSQNPFPRKARSLLDAKGIPYKYLSYGSYLSQWRQRLSLKLWAGWPTFPMVFVKGVLVGGASDLKKLAESGQLDKMLE